MLTQLVPVGSYWTCPNPLAALAVIDPLCPVVWSLMTACNPFGVSRMDTFRLSPEFMNRSFCGSGVNVAVVACTGFAGASARLKMFIAAHHLVGSQALAPTATCHVGQGTQPGG